MARVVSFETINLTLGECTKHGSVHGTGFYPVLSSALLSMKKSKSYENAVQQTTNCTSLELNSSSPTARNNAYRVAASHNWNEVPEAVRFMTIKYLTEAQSIKWYNRSKKKNLTTTTSPSLAALRQDSSYSTKDS
jgi:hypothetical protein